jgi:hypothetical protein
MSLDIWRDDVAVEVGSEIENVVRDAELLANPASVLDIGHRAAPGV